MAYSFYLLITTSKEVAWAEFVQLMTRPVKHVLFPRLDAWGVLTYFEDALGQNGTAALILLVSAAAVVMVTVLFDHVFVSKEQDSASTRSSHIRSLWTRLSASLIPSVRSFATSVKNTISNIWR